MLEKQKCAKRGASEKREKLCKSGDVERTERIAKCKIDSKLVKTTLTAALTPLRCSKGSSN